MNDGTTIEYGYGWHIETYKGIRHPYHTGSTRGFRNAFTRFPDQKFSVIILTNNNDAEPIEAAKRIADIILAHGDLL